LDKFVLIANHENLILPNQKKLFSQISKIISFFHPVGWPPEDVHTPLPVHSSATSGRDETNPGLVAQSLQSTRR